jgi:hypothetical protein
MGVIQTALEKSGLTMEGDRLPKNERTVKTFQRLIAAMRAAEAEVIQSLSQSERQLIESLRINQELQERCHRLENETKTMRLKEKLERIESLSIEDRAKLLEYSGDKIAQPV